MKKILLQFSLFCTLLTVSGIALATPHTPPVRTLYIQATNTVISMDGVADADYSAVQSTTAFNVTGSTGADADYTLTFQVCYNYQKLFLVAKILDDYASAIEYTTDPDPWTRDCIEVFLSLDTTGTTATYDSNTIQLRFNRGIQDSAQTPGRAAQEDYQVYSEEVADGWVLEVGIPWTAVLQTGVIDPGRAMSEIVANCVVNGFDVSGVDNDTDGPDAIDCQTAWDDDDPVMPDTTEDLARNNRTMFGVMTLDNDCRSGVPDVPANYTNNQPQFLFPNPATGTVQLKDIEPASIVAIYNLSGIKVLEKGPLNSEDYIDISGLEAGIYLARINAIEVLKLIKQ
jgi:hypothetical protein